MKDKAFAVIVLAFLAFMGVSAVFFGSGELLPLEKRYPAPAPVFSLKSGETSESTEDYLSDRLPCRNLLTGADALRKQICGMGIDEEILSFGDALNERPLESGTEQLVRNLEALSRFQESVNLNITLITPPTAGYVRGLYGASPLNYPDKELFNEIQARFPGMIPTLDTFTDGSLYYRTDPHWNAQGAYAAYRLCCAALGLQAKEASDFNVTDYPVFRGTCYNRSGLWLTPKEDISVWEDGISYTVTADSAEPRKGLFYLDRLTEADPYQVYLDGNHALTVITGENEGKTLLMLKDSYGNSLCPLLAGHYGKVIMVDLRAYRGRISELGPIDQVLAVYCLDSLMTSTAFARLKY